MGIYELYASAYENAIKNVIEKVNNTLGLHLTYLCDCQSAENLADLLETRFDEDGNIVGD